MKINFPILNNYIVKPIKNNYQNHLKPLPFDTFERISFGNAPEHGTSTHSFDIKNIKNLRCPVCGLIMLTDEQIDDFVDDIKDKRGYDLAYALEQYENETYVSGVQVDNPKTIFRPQKQEIVNIIKNLAKKNPKKTLSELVDIEAKRCINILIGKQMKVVDELEQLIKSSNIIKTKKERARELLDEYKKQIHGTSATRFSRKSFIHDFSTISTADPTVQNKINEVTAKLPTSEKDINSWFVKYSNSKSLTSADIAKKLVQQSIPTAEHLVPKSLAGANSLKNYICDCSECNSGRSNLEFNIWMKTIPNFKEKLQQYLQDIQDAIDSGRISRKNNTYVENIIKSIDELSNHQILLDLPKSTDDGRRIRMLTAREAKIEQIAKHIKEQVKSRREKESEIERLESHPYYQNLFLLETLERTLESYKEEMQNCSDSDKLVQIKQQMKPVQDEIDKCRDYIANAGYIEDQIAQLQKVVSNMQSTQSQLLKLTEQINEETKLRERQHNLMGECTDLSVQNSAIIQSPGFNLKDTKDFEYYRHLTELLQIANLMMSGNIRISKGQNREVIEIAIETIENRIANYLKKDSVIYFLNLDSIQKNKNEIEAINSKLDEIETQKTYVEFYEKDIQLTGKGKTIEQLQYELKQLIESKEIIAKIHELPQYRAELKNLSEAISFNRKIYHDLKKHYEKMSSEEFVYQTSLIY